MADSCSAGEKVSRLEFEAVLVWEEAVEEEVWGGDLEGEVGGGG